MSGDSSSDSNWKWKTGLWILALLVTNLAQFVVHAVNDSASRRQAQIDKINTLTNQLWLTQISVAELDKSATRESTDDAIRQLADSQKKYHGASWSKIEGSQGEQGGDELARQSWDLEKIKYVVSKYHLDEFKIAQNAQPYYTTAAMATHDERREASTMGCSVDMFSELAAMCYPLSELQQKNFVQEHFKECEAAIKANQDKPKKTRKDTAPPAH